MTFTLEQVTTATKRKRVGERLAPVMDYLRALGYTVGKCSYRHFKTGTTQDLFGIADLVAVHPERDGMLLVQATTKGQRAAHITKCRSAKVWPVLDRARVAFALALTHTVTVTAGTGAKLQSHRIEWELLLPGPQGPRAHVFLQQARLPMSGGRRRSRRGRASVMELPPGVVAKGV